MNKVATNNNQAVKRNQSSMQVLKTLQLLLEDNYTMSELIEKLNEKEDEPIFNNSVVSKYINTCRHCGIDIPKIHNKYFVANLPFGLDLSVRDLDLLEKFKRVNLSEFEKLAKTTRATIKKLEGLGCLKIVEDELYRNPLSIFSDTKKEDLYELQGEQKEVYEKISKLKEVKTPILIHGVTASGKTEVYFKLIKDTIEAGKNVLFLAPEIALASQLTKRLARKFGIEDIAIWHSSISEGERYDVW